MKFVIPETVTSQFHLREGDKVADFGAGRGFFLRPLAETVGQEGEVYLCEIQKELVEFVAEQARVGGFGNIKPIWCDLEEVGGVHIADSTLDAGILVNTLYMIEDKAAAMQEMLRTIRPGGNFFVIDWTDTVPGLGPTPDRVISQAECTSLFETHGCTLERDFQAGDHHYGLAFKKV